MRKIRLTVLVVTIILMGVIAYEFLFGKLFPFSPVHPGFEKYELAHTVIYIQDGDSFSDFQRIDTLLSPVEKFHRLRFLSKPIIYIFRDKESYLQRSISKARFCAFYNGSIVISPWAVKEDKEGIISLDIYLAHELSHVLLFQHKGLFSSYKYPKWLLEGTAVYSSNQMGTSFYPDKEETYSLIKKGNFLPPEYFGTDKEDEIKTDVKYRQTFFYSEFACIVDYLINVYGKDTFVYYIKSLIHENDNDAVFKRIFGTDLNGVITNFKQYINKRE